MSSSSVLTTRNEKRPARCGLCGHEPVGPRVTRCGHNLCTRCLTDHLETEKVQSQQQNRITADNHNEEDMKPAVVEPPKKKFKSNGGEPAGLSLGEVQMRCPQTGCNRLLHLPNWHIDNFPPNSTLVAEIKKAKQDQNRISEKAKCKNHAMMTEIYCATCKMQICLKCLGDHRKHDTLDSDTAIRVSRVSCLENARSAIRSTRKLKWKSRKRYVN